MFRLRLLSTIVLLPLAIAGILYLPNIYVAIISGVVIALAAWEWLHMSVFKNNKIRFVLLIAIIAVSYSLLATGLHPMWIFHLTLIWWLCALIGICYFPDGESIWREWTLQPVIALLTFVPGWLAFNILRSQIMFGPEWVLLGCAMIWGSDIGAYIFGKLWGKTKLLKAVSPGKTWVGLYGGIFTSCLIMLAFYLYYQPSFSLMQAMWLAIFTAIFAIIGDLFESMQKRIYGVKDSGTLIPGHGGVFDRLDSMLAGFPIYFLGLQILQNIRIISF
jgi:phosphatidate cytidylyltransferase